MRTNPLSPALILIASVAFGQSFNMGRLHDNVRALKSTNQQMSEAAPADRPALQEQRARLVTDIRSMANSEPQNLEAQMGVAQGFLAADEPREATGFADRAAGLAQEKGDAKALGSALTMGAVAYQKSGDYAAAAARARRALELDPGNRAAMAVYQMSKGRVGASAARASAASGADSAARDGNAPTRPSGWAHGSWGPAPAAARPAVVRVADAAQPQGKSADEQVKKYVAEAAKKWSLDKKDAMRLLDQAVAADPKNAEARVARSRARAELEDGAGALEDAEAALAAGPSADAHAARGEALKALGRQREEVLAAYKAAAELDSRYESLYKTALAADGREWNAPVGGQSAPDREGGMAENVRLRRMWPFGAAAAVGLFLIAWHLFVRRPGE